MVAQSEIVPEARSSAPPERRPPRLGLTAHGSGSTAGLLVKILVLAVVMAIAVWGAFPLIDQERWVLLTVLVLVTLTIFYVYLSPRAIPAKYLLPGTLFLIAFQIVPVIYTVQT